MRAEVIGNLTAEPEFATSANGNGYVNLNVCDRTAGKEKKVYVKVSAFGQRYEKMAQYLHKGSPVIAWGHLEARPYTGKDGEPKAALSMIADRLDFVPKDFSEEGGSAGLGQAVRETFGETENMGIPF